MNNLKQSALPQTSSGNDLRRLRRKARDLAEEGRIFEAIGFQQTLAAMKPDDFEALMQLGFLHQAVSEIDNAAYAFRQAIGLSPYSPDAREALAEMYLDAGRYDDAISSSKAWLRIRPHSIAARDIICTAYLQKGEIRKALETATEMVRLAPIDPIGYYKRGVLHQHDGDWRNAIQQFMFAAEMSPAGSLEHQEAEAAVEAIDQYQVRAIMSLASQDLIFKTHLMRNVDEASRDRGFYISPSATAFIEHILAYHSPEALDCADETKLNVFSYRPQRYN